MTITITLDQADIANTDENDFTALCFILQTYAKIVQAQLPVKHLSKVEKMTHDWADKRLGTKPTTGEEMDTSRTVKKPVENQNEMPADEKSENPLVENRINRKEIETAIKQIALDGKEKGASKKIKEIIHEYGVERLSDVPDEKLPELLERAKAI